MNLYQTNLQQGIRRKQQKKNFKTEKIQTMHTIKEGKNIKYLKTLLAAWLHTFMFRHDLIHFQNL